MSVDPLSEDDELLAAELALGLLDPREHEAACSRIGREPRFAEVCSHWQRRAAMLFETKLEVPAPSVWTTLQDRLPVQGGGVSRRRVALRRWQFATGIATAAAVVLGVLALDGPHRSPVEPAVVAFRPPLVAILRGQGSGVVAVTLDGSTRRLLTAPSTLSVGRRTAELWIIPVDGKPLSLGPMDSRAPSSRLLAENDAHAIIPGATLAISIEPFGGSPTGQPTGPIVAKGAVNAT